MEILCFGSTKSSLKRSYKEGTDSEESAEKKKTSN